MHHSHNQHQHMHEHHHEVSNKTVRYLFLSFLINIALSIIEIIGGIIAGSVSLIGDALHNTSDAFSILIAVIAFKISRKKANTKYTYGFKRAEIIGGFVNLILLFISGIYLAVEGIGRIISPKPIDGSMIIWVSVLALIVDTVTAKLSHQDADKNTNMKMVFLHNLADALGSVGVIISGLFVIWMDIYRIDGIVALGIAAYMIYQSVLSFPRIVNILMNAAPDYINTADIEQALRQIPGVKDVHHLHIWCVNEKDVSLDCHLVADDTNPIQAATRILNNRFQIIHTNIQVEKQADCQKCCL